MNDTIINARKAVKSLIGVSDARRSEVLLKLADAIVASKDELLSANAADLALMDPANPLYDRLKLTGERLEGIAADMRKVAALPSPLGRILAERTLPNGLRLRKVSVPFGVIGVVYEARPNVTSTCSRSASAAAT